MKFVFSETAFSMWQMTWRTMVGFLLFAVVGVRFAMALPADQPEVVPPALLAQLEDVLAERTTDLTSRLELIKQIDVHLEKAPSSDARTEIGHKVRFVEALTNMRLHNLELSAEQIADLQAKVDVKKYPALAFNCRSLQAAILLMRGKKTESLTALQDLLSSAWKEVPELHLNRARINLAVALKECGRLDEAIQKLQAVMFSAIERGQDSAALQAGNNLITILRNGRSTAAVRQAIAELEPVMARNPKTMGAQSIHLFDLEAMSLEGQLDEAIAGLREFIDRREPLPPPILLASAHQKLAEALDANGKLEEALAHARQAVTYFGPTYEAIHARISLAKILLHRGDLEEALAEITNVDIAHETNPAIQQKVYQIQLETRLRLEGDTEAAKLVTALLRAVDAQENGVLKIVADDFERRVSLLRANLTAQHAAAHQRAELEANRADSYRRYFVYGLLTIGGLCGSVLTVINWRRRTERLKLAEQTAQNAKLEALVEYKTRELKANLEAQAEMAQALERKKRMETIGLLAGNVAHDINNLLQVIANANETLSSPDANESLRSQALSVSDESLRHGSGIIRQILAYSRQQELSARPIRVHDYLSNSRALFHSAVGATIELRMEDQSQDSFICVDPSHLTTAILNILSNSAHAMPAGGHVNIKSELHTISTVAPDAWHNLPMGQYLLLKIEDNGCGMNAEQLSRAFEPFFSTKSVGEGTGLGLSSVHGFVRQSGGDVRLLSTPGSGTVVEIYLPISAPALIGMPPQASLPAEPYANKRLLLVEDHQAVARSLMLLLAHIKLRASWAASGDEAVRILEKDPAFDFVLSDVHMPGSMNGLALSRWIRQQLPHIRVFLMSGYNDLPQDKIDVPLLQKPFKLNELSDLLNQTNSASLP